MPGESLEISQLEERLRDDAGVVVRPRRRDRADVRRLHRVAVRQRRGADRRFPRGGRTGFQEPGFPRREGNLRAERSGGRLRLVDSVPKQRKVSLQVLGGGAAKRPGRRPPSRVLGGVDGREGSGVGESRDGLGPGSERRARALLETFQHTLRKRIRDVSSGGDGDGHRGGGGVGGPESLGDSHGEVDRPVVHTRRGASARRGDDKPEAKLRRDARSVGEPRRRRIAFPRRLLLDEPRAPFLPQPIALVVDGRPRRAAVHRDNRGLVHRPDAELLEVLDEPSGGDGEEPGAAVFGQSWIRAQAARRRPRERVHGASGVHQAAVRAHPGSQLDAPRE